MQCESRELTLYARTHTHRKRSNTALRHLSLTKQLPQTH
jgi:hypothetical protein